MRTTILRKQINDTVNLLNLAYDVVEDSLVNIVTALGGLVRTGCPGGISNDVNPPIYATCSSDLDFQQDPVYGIRVFDGEIYLLTQTSLENYGVDTGYYFGGNEKSDKVHFERALSDLTYFIAIGPRTFVRRPTLWSIISGLAAFINEK